MHLVNNFNKINGLPSWAAGALALHWKERKIACENTEWTDDRLGGTSQHKALKVNVKVDGELCQ